MKCTAIIPILACATLTATAQAFTLEHTNMVLIRFEDVGLSAAEQSLASNEVLRLVEPSIPLIRIIRRSGTDEDRSERAHV